MMKSKKQQISLPKPPNKKPLQTFLINNSYILYVFPGRLSKFDILLRYRQIIKKETIHGVSRLAWSNIRTPKHIHWAVDVLIKMHQDKKLSQKFLKFLINKWQKISPIKSKTKLTNLLSLNQLTNESQKESYRYSGLNNFGEYSIKFLILLATLLMQQEKNNRKDAYMFKFLLEKLLEGKDIFSIVSAASFRGKK